jgi:FAD/FMN-containing dehydrogenase/Fe-S oxidoreductase
VVRSEGLFDAATMIVEPPDVLRIERRDAPPEWRALADELRSVIAGEVRFDAGSRGVYAMASSNYRQVPIGVVLPRTTEDIVRTIDACRRHHAPVLPRGGGTSLAGQCSNVAVVLDMSKYLHGVVAIDPEAQSARVEPGLVLDVLQQAARPHGLFFPPDPATHARCTLGGMIGNNSCGVHSVMGGKTADNTMALDVLPYDGTRMRVGETSDAELARIIAEGGRRGAIYAALKELRDRYGETIRRGFPKIPRRVSGYNLEELLPENGFNVARALVGTEGTCVTVLEATVRLWPAPKARSVLVLGYPDVYVAADQVPAILESRPMALEGMDDRLVEAMRTKGMHLEHLRLLPEGGGWLLVEFGGQTKDEADAKALALTELLRRTRGPHPSMKLYDDATEEEHVWKLRESAVGATSYVPGQPPMREGWEDAAVPPERLGVYLREFRALLDRYGYGCSLYGHFGDGCIHTRIDFDFSSAPGVATFRSFVDDAADLVVSHGGSLSGEHGDGQARAELLPKMFGPELIQAFREFKAIWDPENKMNPGKVVDPYPITADLRFGAGSEVKPLKTHFAFQQEGGTWEAVGLRCVGVGKCRDFGGATMCPSYMATREEEHSTRGRARLLYEMIAPDGPISNGWRDDAVKEALDLCLACKACKRDCPVNVDMATYKAEFLSHYYEGRLRPRAAYSMGLIMYAAQAASKAPRLANAVTQGRVTSRILKRLGGVDARRSVPRFAERTFRDWFSGREERRGDGKAVVLFPDTFTNFFQPQIGIAATELLEEAGYRVLVPPKPFCCGRPLYDYGMLKPAKRFLRRVLDVMRPRIADGTPVIGLEPSCTAVFRDELTGLLPGDRDAVRLREQTMTLAEFLTAEGYESQHLARRALVQKHCHHDAIMSFDADAKLLDQTLDAEILVSGCCGMAGSFGFEPGDKFDVSMRAGERVLLPRIRAADEETLIVADGFSCREQISQATGRKALHLAEVLRMAQREGSTG